MSLQWKTSPKGQRTYRYALKERKETCMFLKSEKVRQKHQITTKEVRE